MKGFGTFIGIEHNFIESINSRLMVTHDSIISALQNGYRHFDLAANYNNFSAIKLAFQNAFKANNEGGLGLNREDVWITMKGHARSSADIDVLIELTGLSYFDLNLEHHPTYMFENQKRLLSHWGMLCKLSEDKVRHIGVSNCYQEHLQWLIDCCTENHLKMPYANQIEINLYNQEHELVLFCQERDIKVIAYSPLSYNMSSFLPNFDEQCATLNCTNKQYILAWLVSRKITVIPSSRSSEHQKENFSIDRLISFFKEQNHVDLESFHEHDVQEPCTTTASEFKQAAKTIRYRF